ncbi:uncharacterized protein LOC144348173 [Saccoglossus kowalevskii]
MVRISGNFLFISMDSISHHGQIQIALNESGHQTRTDKLTNNENDDSDKLTHATITNDSRDITCSTRTINMNGYGSDGNKSGSSKTWKETEAEMEAKITWVRNEIKSLKLQDQSLMRQFLDLRSVINQMKLTRCGSVGDVSLIDSSTEELDERPLENVTSSSTSCLMGDNLPSFMRGRTTSLSGTGRFAKTSRLVPKTSEVFL